MSEHLKYAHPILVTQLTHLFKCIALHGYVPDRFGEGIIVPIVKDKAGNQNDVNNYRGITLTSVISKLFELIILEICEEYLVTHEMQFGFKKNSGCNHAIFVMTEVIKYYLENGSSVFLSALDLTKAFDKVNHYKLFTALLKKRTPIWVILVLENWYSKLTSRVRWNNVYSDAFSVKSGVRQGGHSLLRSLMC